MARATNWWTRRGYSGSSAVSLNCEGDMKAVGASQWAVGSRLWAVGGRVAAIVLLCATATFGQDRLPPIPADKLTEAQKKAAAEFQLERKQEVFGPFVPLSRSPQLMINAARMGT